MFDLFLAVKKPRAWAIGVTVVLAIMVALLGVVIMAIAALGDWHTRFAGYPGTGPSLAVLLALACLSVGAAIWWPVLMMRSLRWLADDPHTLAAYFAGLFVMTANYALIAPLLGFVGSFIFLDVRVFFGGMAMASIPLALRWPTGARWSNYEARLRAAGKLRPPAQSEATA